MIIKYASFDKGNGLVPSGQQAIARTNTAIMNQPEESKEKRQL